jgi:hypothetical protein
VSAATDPAIAALALLLNAALEHAPPLTRQLIAANAQPHLDAIARRLADATPIATAAQDHA